MIMWSRICSNDDVDVSFDKRNVHIVFLILELDCGGKKVSYLCSLWWNTFFIYPFLPYHPLAEGIQ